MVGCEYTFIKCQYIVFIDFYSDLDAVFMGGQFSLVF
ncbi:hypothetical protein IIG_01431 [Bacillus cereus VD048]|uniref:Uncharacterized protein n=1 Tax=Bacillus cereus VD048 TaxID=1053226 RepID=J8I7F1_BACCE|nr:hypothetical protein IIG_01431 [Bacillus cereus VD048]